MRDGLMDGTKMSPKMNAYSGWGSAFFGGISLGAGISIIAITRMVMDFAPNWGLTVTDPQPFANVQLVGAVLAFMGIVFGVIGFYEISVSQRIVPARSTIPIQQPVSTTEKKFCRYCGTENSKDAVFCEKCGKKISSQG